MKIIRTGDLVHVSGSWGQDEPKVLMVTSLERVLKGEKYGWAVRQVFDTDDYVAVLDDGSWAYSWQIQAFEDAPETIEITAETITKSIGDVDRAYIRYNGRIVLHGFILGAWGARIADRFTDEVWRLLADE